MAKISRVTKIGSYGHADSVERFEYDESQASLSHIDRHSAFVGDCFILKLRSPAKHVLMQAAAVTVISPNHGWVEGFVEVDADGGALDDLEDEHTGVFGREMWTWYS
jgi:hypothetical protein